VAGQTVSAGFNDQDIIQTSRALSGWTVSRGALAESRDAVSQAPAGTFTYIRALHNNQAGSFMGVNLAPLSADMAQGSKVIEITALHPATATFVVTKIARRIFGDAPPKTVVARGVDAWIAHQSAPNQIAKVLEAMLIDGPEVGNAASVKVRRPYEHFLAIVRTTDMVLNASPQMGTYFDSVRDGLHSWTGPNGRPDNNAYWLGTGSNLLTWNSSLQLPFGEIALASTLDQQTPDSAKASPTGLVEYWVERMIGFQVSSDAMTALISDQADSQGVLAALRKSSNALTVEGAYRRLAGLISTTSEFVYR